jgi:uncharacterized membrane protein
VTDRALDVFTLVCALGAGLVAGAFFAFSTFVMRALARLPTAHGIAAMQTINVTVFHPLFMGALFGTAVLGLVRAGVALASGEPGTTCLVTGALVYLVGVVGVTGAFNVPRNAALARADPASGDAARLWADYLVTWTAWNHVRTVAALAAAAAFTWALHVARGAHLA